MLIWVQKQDRSLDEVFSLHSEIAAYPRGRQLCVFGCTAGNHQAIRDQGMWYPALSGFTSCLDSCLGKEKAGTNTLKGRLSFRMLVPAKLDWFGSYGANILWKAFLSFGDTA